MNEEEEDLEVIEAEENQNYFERNMNDDMEMMEENSEPNDEEPSVDPVQKQRELERRLQSELNLRMGNMAYAYDDDDEEDQNGDDRIEESKHHQVKKKKSAKKMKETTENNKLKQTRLIFTPKDQGMTGHKRPHPDSPKEFNDDEEDEE